MLPPMPSEPEVNAMYDALMSELGFDKGFKHPTAYQTSAAATTSLENKWAMICQYKSIAQMKQAGKVEQKPQYWAQRLETDRTKLGKKKKNKRKFLLKK